MIAVTDILLSVVVFVAGFIGGRISKRAPTPGKSTPACDTCGHGRGFHTDGHGTCTAPVAFVDGIQLKTTSTCKCQVWDGPERPEDVLRGFQG